MSTSMKAVVKMMARMRKGSTPEMMATLSRRWPEFADLRNKELLQRVMHLIWHYRSSDGRNEFVERMRFQLKPQGFRDAVKAPWPRVWQMLNDSGIATCDFEYPAGILAMWEEASPELAAAVDGYLAKQGIAGMRERLNAEDVEHRWSEATMRMHAAALQAEYSHEHIDEIELMLCIRSVCRLQRDDETEYTVPASIASLTAADADVQKSAEPDAGEAVTMVESERSEEREIDRVDAAPALGALRGGTMNSAGEEDAIVVADSSSDADDLDERVEQDERDSMETVLLPSEAMRRHEFVLQRMRAAISMLSQALDEEQIARMSDLMARLQERMAEVRDASEALTGAVAQECAAIATQLEEIEAEEDRDRMTNILVGVRRGFESGRVARLRAAEQLESLRGELSSYRRQRAELFERIAQAGVERAALLQDARDWRVELDFDEFAVPAVPVPGAAQAQLRDRLSGLRAGSQRLEALLQERVAAVLRERRTSCRAFVAPLEAAREQGVAAAVPLLRRLQRSSDSPAHSMRRDDVRALLRFIDEACADAVKLLEEIGVERAAQRVSLEPNWDSIRGLVGSLWLRKDYARAFVVQTAALRAGYGPTDDLRAANLLQSYLRDAAAFLKQDSAPLVRQMLLDSYWQSLTLKLSAEDNTVFAMLITAHAISGDPHCGAAEVWQPLAGAESLMRERTPRWFTLADRILNGAEWTLAQHAVDYQDRRRDLENAMRAEFVRRQDGRYARVSADGISVMLQIEQQKLLPELEKRTEALIAAVPGTDAWAHLTQELSASAESVFDRFFGGLDQSRHSHMRRNLLHRLNGMRDLWREYAALRSEQRVHEDQRPFVVSELHAEIEAVADLLGGTMKSVVHDLLDRAAARTPFAEATAEPFVENDFFGTRMKSLLLSCADVVRMFPTAAEYVFTARSESAVTWDRLIACAAQDLHQSLPSAEMLRRFAESGFFFGAEAVAAESDAAAMQSLLAERAALEVQIDQMMKRLREPDAMLQEWRRTGRLRALAARLQQDLVVQDEIERQQDEERRRKVESLLKKLKNDVRDLEDQLSELSMQGEMSQQTTDELTRGLDEARNVVLRRNERGIETALHIVEEVIHFIVYEGSALENVTRAIDRHREEISQPERAEAEDRTAPKIRVPIESAEWIDELRKDGLSDSQIAVRKEVWECWQRMRGMQSRLNDGGVAGEEAEILQTFARKYAEVTRLMYGRTSETLFSAKPLAFFETRFQQPRDALRRYRMRFLFVTGAVTKRDLRILEDHLRTLNLLEDGWLNVFVAPRDDAALALSAWINRTHMLATSSVLDGRTLQTILACRHNPTAAGRMCRLLLQSVDPVHIGVFRFQNVVDSETDIFKGRAHEIRRIETGRSSFFIYGGRRIGKTSLLFAAEKHLQKGGASTAYVSFEGHSDPQGLTVCRDVLRKLGVPHRCDSLDDFRTLFTEYAHRVAAEKPDKLERREVVVFLDEVDRYITGCREAGQRSHTLIHVLRSLHQELHGKARFVMAGAIELWRQLNGRSDIPGAETPWANFGEHIALGALNAADARAIVNTGFCDVLGIGVAEGVDRQIVENTTGHPAFVQFYCDKLHKRLHQRNGDLLTMEDVVQAFKDRRSDSFVTYARDTLSLNLGDLTRLSVYLLAIERCDRFGPADLSRLAPGYQVPAEMPWPQCLDELQMTGVIRAEGGVYRFSVPTYPELLRQMEQSLQDDVAQLIEKIGAAYDAANGGGR